MAYEISTENHGTWLLFRAKGTQTFEANAALLAVVVEETEKTGVFKVVIDLRGMTGQPGKVYDFELAKMAKGNLLGQLKKGALIYEPEREEYTKFFEQSCKAMGLNVRSFLSEKEAIEWIE